MAPAGNAVTVAALPAHNPTELGDIVAKAFVVTDKEDDVKKLIKKGYTVQDVDVLVVPGTFKSLVKYYTLILN